MRKRPALLAARRRIAASACALLILFSALLPLMAQAGDRLFGLVTWVELCTGYGIEVIAIDLDGNPVDTDDESNTRCMVCTVCASTFVLPSTALSAPAPEVIGHHVPCRGYLQPDTAEYVHHQSQPRAPPAIAG